jgi:hypothetical protein
MRPADKAIERPNPFRKFTKLYDLEERRREIEAKHPERSLEFADIQRSQERLRRGLRSTEARFERTPDEFGDE